MSLRHAPAFVLLLATIAAPLHAQETQFASDLRREGEHVAESCGEFNVKALGGCAYTLATESPFHLALGSLAPQNGFAFGLAFGEHFTPNEAWRLSWNADAVSSLGGARRGGVYMKFIHTPATSGVRVVRPGASGTPVAIAPREDAMLDLFAQTISLKTINFFGTGPQSLQSGRSIYGERQTIVGASATVPIDGLADWAYATWLNPSVVGGVNLRLVDIRGGSNQAPSIEQVYDDQTAPGLSQQKPFVQLHGGLRLKPSLPNGRLRLDYMASAEWFRTDNRTQGTFARWTLDLHHEIPLYRRVSSSGPRAFNGPNECAQSVGSHGCPPVSWSRNREGTINLRFLASTTTTSSGNRVPFYFQQTLGGSDINGERQLASYDDYRFRGPHLIELQENVEHSLWGPIGVFVQAEQGKVADRHGDLNFSNLKSSTTVGLTLRAGGFPMVNLSFSWGDEGHHIIGAMNTSLLGGSSRPGLY